jgi:FkbM family methyltransferase
MRYVSPGDGRIWEEWGREEEYLGIEPGVVIDVGAYIGYVALRMREWWPGAEIHCFEPVRGSYEALVENVEGKDINAYNRACWDKDCEIILGMDTAGDKNLGRMSYLTTGSRAERVVAVRLDGFREWGRVDLIKVDAEGAEDRVLRGAHNLIIRDWPMLQVEGGTPDYLLELGYECIGRKKGDRIHKKDLSGGIKPYCFAGR